MAAFRSDQVRIWIRGVIVPRLAILVEKSLRSEVDDVRKASIVGTSVALYVKRRYMDCTGRGGTLRCMDGS